MVAQRLFARDFNKRKPPPSVVMMMKSERMRHNQKMKHDDDIRDSPGTMTQLSPQPQRQQQRRERFRAKQVDNNNNKENDTTTVSPSQQHAILSKEKKFKRQEHANKKMNAEKRLSPSIFSPSPPLVVDRMSQSPETEWEEEEEYSANNSLVDQSRPGAFSIPGIMQSPTATMVTNDVFEQRLENLDQSSEQQQPGWGSESILHVEAVLEQQSPVLDQLQQLRNLFVDDEIMVVPEEIDNLDDKRVSSLSRRSTSILLKGKLCCFTFSLVAMITMVITLTIIFARDEPSAPTATTITTTLPSLVDVVAQQNDLSMFYQFLQQTNLADLLQSSPADDDDDVVNNNSGERNLQLYTVFAPVDAAWASWLDSKYWKEDKWKWHLHELIQLHIALGVVHIFNITIDPMVLSNDQSFDLLNGEFVSIIYSNDTSAILSCGYFNSTVVKHHQPQPQPAVGQADPIVASTGILYQMDTFFQPYFLSRTLWDTLASEWRLHLLYKLVTLSSLEIDWRTTEWTMFHYEADVSNILSLNDANMARTFLSHHIIPNLLPYALGINDGTNFRTLSNDTITISDSTNEKNDFSKVLSIQSVCSRVTTTTTRPCFILSTNGIIINMESSLWWDGCDDNVHRIK